MLFLLIVWCFVLFWGMVLFCFLALGSFLVVLFFRYLRTNLKLGGQGGGGDLEGFGLGEDYKLFQIIKNRF